MRTIRVCFEGHVEFVRTSSRGRDDGAGEPCSWGESGEIVTALAAYRW
jgi:hypothetical protein